jgi:glycopeptide antibiotics resistance protein
MDNVAHVNTKIDTMRDGAEIPALPVLIPLTAVALAVLLWQLHRRGSLTVLRAGVVIATCVYGAGLLNAVLLPFRLTTDNSGYQMPWRVWIDLTPLINSDPAGLYLNAALFLPLGVLLPLVARIRSVRQVLLVGFLLSLGIELIQFAADLTISTGRVADVDDLLSNCFGALAGYLLFLLAIRVPGAARLVAAATWPAPREADQKAQPGQGPANVRT